MGSYSLTNKANSLAFEVEIDIPQKFCHFGRYDTKTKLFCQKSFVPITRAGVFIWENFHPGYPDLGNRARGPFLESLENFGGRKAIFSLSVSKNGEVYTPKTSCMEGTFLHIKNM